MVKTCGMVRRITIQMHSRMAWVVILVPMQVLATICPNKATSINSSILTVISNLDIMAVAPFEAVVEVVVASVVEEALIRTFKVTRLTLTTTNNHMNSNKLRYNNYKHSWEIARTNSQLRPQMERQKNSSKLSTFNSPLEVKKKLMRLLALIPLNLIWTEDLPLKNLLSGQRMMKTKKMTHMMELTYNLLTSLTSTTMLSPCKLLLLYHPHRKSLLPR